MIIITGASRGVGKYLFDTLSNDYSPIIGTYLSTNCEVSKNKYKVDISDYESIRHFYRSIADFASEIVLINCAGISYSAFAHKSEPELWKKVIDVNLIGTYNMIRCFLPLMREQNYGRIINLSSVVAQYPTPGVSAYAASKAALTGLTKSLAIENGNKGISVNVINLGYATIGMGENDVPQEYKEKIIKQIPKGRFCYPEEIYNTIKFLIDTDYVNGSILDINGGMI